MNSPWPGIDVGRADGDLYFSPQRTRREGEREREITSGLGGPCKQMGLTNSKN